MATSSVTSGGSIESKIPLDSNSGRQEYIKYYKEMKKYFTSLINTIDGNKTESTVKQQPKLTPKEKRRLKRKRREQNKKAQKYQDIDDDDDNEISDYPSNNDNSSESIMRHYLSEFGSSGEWDWNSWKTYLHNMSESSPQWYAMFLEHSRAIGIDWAEMFRSWEQAEELKALAFKRQAEIHEDTTSDSSSSSSEDENDGTDSKPHWSRCKLCQRDFRSELAFVTHLRGLSHMQLVLERKKKRHPDKYIEETERENAVIKNDLSKEEKHFEWVRNNMQNEELELSGTFFCDICKVTCSSDKDIAVHLNGKRHTQNLANPQNKNHHVKIPRLVASTGSRSGHVVSRITTLLNMCMQALVGLNYVIEFQPLDSHSPSRYHCQLCYSCLRKTLLPDRVIGHIVGYKHRRLFMKYNYPDLYEIIALDKSSISVKNKRVDVYAKRVEDEISRKRINIRLEIQSESEKQKRYKLYGEDDDFFYNDHSESSSDDDINVEEVDNFNPLDYDENQPLSNTPNVESKPLFHVKKGLPDPDKEKFYDHLQKEGYLSLPSITNTAVAQFHAEADWAIQRKKNGLGNILSTYAKRSTSEVAAAAATAYILSMQQISEKISDITGLGIDLNHDGASSRRRRRKGNNATTTTTTAENSFLLQLFENELTSMDQIKDLFSKIKSMEQEYPTTKDVVKKLSPIKNESHYPVCSQPIPVITSSSIRNTTSLTSQDDHHKTDMIKHSQRDDYYSTTKHNDRSELENIRKEERHQFANSSSAIRRDYSADKNHQRYASKSKRDIQGSPPTNHFERRRKRSPVDNSSYRSDSGRRKTKTSRNNSSVSKRSCPIDLDDTDDDDAEEDHSPKKLSSLVFVPQKKSRDDESPPPVSNLISNVMKSESSLSEASPAKQPVDVFDAYSLFSTAVKTSSAIRPSPTLSSPTNNYVSKERTPSSSNYVSKKSANTSTLSKINKLYGYADPPPPPPATAYEPAPAVSLLSTIPPAAVTTTTTTTDAVALPPSEELNNIDVNVDELKAILGSVQSSENKTARLSHPKLPGLVLDDVLPSTPIPRPRFGILPSISHPALQSPFFLHQAGMGLPPPPPPPPPYTPNSVANPSMMMDVPPPFVSSPFVMSLSQIPTTMVSMPHFVIQNMQPSPRPPP